MYTKALILALLPTAFCHIGLWDPSVFDFNGDGYTLVTPMSGLSFNDWWFHGMLLSFDPSYGYALLVTFRIEINTYTGNLNKKPTGSPMALPAGGSVTVELACNKAYSS